MSDLDLKPANKTKKAPAKRWRNRWTRVVGGTYSCNGCGQTLTRKRGEQYWSHCRTYPSKDVAETKAMEYLAGSRAAIWDGAWEVE